MYNTTYQQYMVEEGIQELTSLCMYQQYITQRNQQTIHGGGGHTRANLIMYNTTYQQYMVEEGIQELTSLCITQRTNNTWWRRAYKS